jgi:hypothetical protein
LSQFSPSHITSLEHLTTPSFQVSSRIS